MLNTPTTHHRHPTSPPLSDDEVSSDDEESQVSARVTPRRSNAGKRKAAGSDFHYGAVAERPEYHNIGYGGAA